jgi:hypothetical protein
MEGDLEGTAREILTILAAKAVLRIEFPPAETFGARDSLLLSNFHRYHGRGEKRPALEILNDLGIEFLLEPERIRILPTLQARQYWATWLSNEKGG